MKRFYLNCTEEFEAELNGILDQCTGEKTEIIFAPGEYYFHEGINLEERHKNLTFKGEGDVRLRGGQLLKEWRSLTEEEATRFDENARAHVLACDLKDAGVKKLSDFISRGFYRLTRPGHSELFADGEPLTLAQYPKAGSWAHIDGVLNPKSDEWGTPTKVSDFKEGFICKDERVKKWKLNDDIWTFGYWVWDWAPTYEHLVSYDAANGHVQLEDTGLKNYGFREGQRIRFYNVMEEVNEPGDYYIDRKNWIAYYYPKQEGQQIVISTLNEPLFNLSHCENITFENLTLEMTCGMAISEDYTENLRVDNCTLAYTGTYAMDLFYGHDIVVENSTIHDCGDGGIQIFGGNRVTLEHMNTKILNNHIYKIGKWDTCYMSGVHAMGVGVSVQHNLMHDMPHTAILYWGNDMTITDNEIYRAILETGDAGAIYSGRDYTFRGNKVNHNYIHHTGRECGWTFGIYNDDCLSGTEMHDNFIEDVTEGIIMGGGRDFSMKNNVFIKCEKPFIFDSRGTSEHKVWQEMVGVKMRNRFFYIKNYDIDNIATERIELEKEKHKGEHTSGMSELYLSRYPELKALGDIYNAQRHCDSVAIQGTGDFSHNVFVPWKRLDNPFAPGEKYEKGQIMNHPLDGNENDVRYNSNYCVRKPMEEFEDFAWGNYQLKPHTPAYRFGYANVEFSSIGLREASRKVNPAKVRTCLVYDADAKELKIGLRNEKAEPVSGSLKIVPSKEIEITIRYVDFAIEGYEEKWYTVPVESVGKEGRVDVYSNVPGVRPASL